MAASRTRLHFPGEVDDEALPQVQASDDKDDASNATSITPRPIETLTPRDARTGSLSSPGPRSGLRLSRLSRASGDSGGSNDKEEKSKGSKSTMKQVFVDAKAMKEKIRMAAVKPVYSVFDYYHDKGLFQKIARHQKFENVTLSIIAFNALWIAVDTDLNHADVLLNAKAEFQIAEQLFCFYFSLEWFIRFMSFKKKRNGLRDAWFVFDSCLVGTMVLETWVMTIVLVAAGSGSGGGGLGNASLLRMARLLRLSRMARMARLFKAMPELLILIKAMAASLRSCTFVFMLLTLILYVFGIAFRQLTDGSNIGDKYFSSIFHAMYTLWIDGTLLDSTGNVARDLLEVNFGLVLMFYVFLLLSALTVMNMLIGVLCEVVSAVAQTEKESLTVSWVKGKLQEILSCGLDEDDDGAISKEELSKLLNIPEACKALGDVGVDCFMLVDNIDFIFSSDDDNEDEEDKKLSFEDFMNLILDLRGSNTATVKDIVELRKYIKLQNKRLRDDLKSSEQRVTNLHRTASKIWRNDDDYNPQSNSRIPSKLKFNQGQLSQPLSDFNSPSSPLNSKPQSFAFDPTTWSVDASADKFKIYELRTQVEDVLQKSLIPELHKICDMQSDCLAELQSLARQVRSDWMERDADLLGEGQIIGDTGGASSLTVKSQPSTLRHAGFAGLPANREFSDEARLPLPTVLSPLSTDRGEQDSTSQRQSLRRQQPRSEYAMSWTQSSRSLC